nr:protein kinase-like domain, phloem protein 2-like protein [Tanacetum cinerariifolium]
MISYGIMAHKMIGVKDNHNTLKELLNNQISTLLENILFEILSGTLAYDSVYLDENNKGLTPISRLHFSGGTLKELIDPTMMVEDNEQIFTLNKGPNQDSFNAFTKIAYQCLAESQAKRPPNGSRHQRTT